jgi:hypothetical protein
MFVVTYSHVLAETNPQVFPMNSHVLHNNTSDFAHEVWDIKLFLAERLGRDPGIDNKI